MNSVVQADRDSSSSKSTAVDRDEQMPNPAVPAATPEQERENIADLVEAEEAAREMREYVASRHGGRRGNPQPGRHKSRRIPRK